MDEEQLRRARVLGACADSQLFDRALALFIREVEGERERAALLAQPYDDDPEVALPDPLLDGFLPLPYDGDVPPAVREAARRRRA